MNIFLHELKAFRKSTVIWTCSLAAIVIFFMSVFPSFAKDINDARKVMESFPEGIRKALGMVLENYFNVLGFYSFVFIYITLCGSIQAMNFGTTALSKEVREKTADFLLTKPVSRTKIMTAKLLAALASILVTDLICLAVASIMVSAVKSGPFSTKVFLLISLTLLLVQMIFMSIGVVISAAARKIRSVLPVTLGTVFGFFILNMLNSVLDEKALRYFIPFLYYNSGYIMKNASYETQFVVIEIVFVAAAIAASYFIYARKDIHAV